MTTYTLTTGETIELDGASDEERDFFARMALVANDPTKPLHELVELLYSDANPVLAPGPVPGRGLVTAEVFERPIYRAMLDLSDLKNLVLGHTLRDNYTMTVAEASEETGMTPHTIRAAVNRGAIDGRKQGGTWMLDPDSVASYALAKRRNGPETRGRPRRATAVRVRRGKDKPFNLMIRHDGQEEPGEFSPAFEPTHELGQAEDITITNFERIVVMTAHPKTGVESRILIPSPGASGSFSHRGFFVVGEFEVERVERSTKAAREIFNATPTPA